MLWKWGFWIIAFGWKLGLLGPCDPVLFSERNGYLRPILRCGPWRLFLTRHTANAGGERTSPPPCSASDVSAKYNELLYAVARKFPGESRHETALRYIRQAEEVHAGPCMQNNTHQRMARPSAGATYAGGDGST